MNMKRRKWHTKTQSRRIDDNRTNDDGNECTLVMYLNPKLDGGILFKNGSFTGIIEPHGNRTCPFLGLVGWPPDFDPEG